MSGIGHDLVAVARTQLRVWWLKAKRALGLRYEP